MKYYFDLNYFFSEMPLPYELIENERGDGIFTCVPHLVPSKLTDKNLDVLDNFKIQFSLKDHLLYLLNLDLENVEFNLNRIFEIIFDQDSVCIIINNFITKKYLFSENLKNIFLKRKPDIEDIIKGLIPYSSKNINFYITICLFQFFLNYVADNHSAFIEFLYNKRDLSDSFFESFYVFFNDTCKIPSDIEEFYRDKCSSILSNSYHKKVPGAWHYYGSHGFKSLINYLQSNIPVQMIPQTTKQLKHKYERSNYDWNEFMLTLEDKFQCFAPTLSDTFPSVLDIKLKMHSSATYNDASSSSFIIYDINQLDTSRVQDEAQSNYRLFTYFKTLSNFIYSQYCNKISYSSDIISSNIHNNISNIFYYFRDRLKTYLSRLEQDNKIPKESKNFEQEQEHKLLVTSSEMLFVDFIKQNPFKVSIVNDIIQYGSCNNLQSFIRAISSKNFTSEHDLCAIRTDKEINILATFIHLHYNILNLNYVYYNLLYIKKAMLSNFFIYLCLCEAKISHLDHELKVNISTIEKYNALMIKYNGNLPFNSFCKEEQVFYKKLQKLQIYPIYYFEETNLLYQTNVSNFFDNISYKKFFSDYGINMLKSNQVDNDCFTLSTFLNFNKKELGPDFTYFNLLYIKNLLPIDLFFKNMHQLLITKNLDFLHLPKSCENFNHFVQHLQFSDKYWKFAVKNLKQEKNIASYKPHKSPKYLISDFNSLLYAEVDHLHSFCDSTYLYLCKKCGNFAFKSHTCTNFSLLNSITDWYDMACDIPYDKSKIGINDNETYNWIRAHALATYTKICRNIILKYRFFAECDKIKEDINIIQQRLNILFTNKPNSMFETLIFDLNQNIENWSIIDIYQNCNISHVEKANLNCNIPHEKNNDFIYNEKKKLLKDIGCFLKIKIKEDYNE